MRSKPTVRELLKSLEERTIHAEERASRAEELAERAEVDARLARLQSMGSGNQSEKLPALARFGAKNGAGGGVSRMSRREALTKGALAGAAGLAAVAVSRPTPVEAAYSLQGDASNPASSATSIVAIAGYLNGSYVFRADASPTHNATQAIDGLQGQGAGVANGVRAWGGQLNGPGVYSQGGGTTGVGLVALGGTGFANGINTNGGGTGGYGIHALGGNGAGSHGVWGQGGPSGGNGVRAFGTVGYDGLYGAGGAGGSNQGGGHGVTAQGGIGNGGFTSGDGLLAFGGNNTATGAAGSGVVATGGGPDGVGGVFTGVGTGAPIRLSAAGTAGPPAGAHLAGDIWLDSNGVMWVCTNGINFFPLQSGGLNNALFTAVSTSQYTLASSDGSTWHDVNATNLSLTITPSFNCQAILSGNSDLWTSTAGFNQDLGILISGGAYPTVAGQPEAWKESGGFAGTFSPNAAFVETVKPLVAGTTYTIKLQWKANKNAPGATIWAGAGPIPLGSSTFSPTRLTALLIVSA